MLEIMGKGYVIEHCISLFQKEQIDKSYRIYITDALQAIANNSAGSDKRVSINKRWIDVVEPTKIQETRTEKEIVNDIRKKIRGLGGEKK